MIEAMLILLLQLLVLFCCHSSTFCKPIHMEEVYKHWKWSTVRTLPQGSLISEADFLWELLMDFFSEEGIKAREAIGRCRISQRFINCILQPAYLFYVNFPNIGNLSLSKPCKAHFILLHKRLQLLRKLLSCWICRWTHFTSSTGTIVTAHS